MQNINLGPISLPIQWAIVLTAIILANILAAWQKRKRGIALDNSIWYWAMATLLLSRVGFVVMHWSHYQGHWRQIINIKDGGLSWQIALLSGFLGFVIIVWRHRQAWRWVALSMAIPFVCTIVGLSALHAHNQSQSLPDVLVQDLSGNVLSLKKLSGKKVVLNLWATWCPPCQREMPILQAAQKAYPDVHFVLVNQSESLEAVKKYLANEQLYFNHVYLDPKAELGQAVGSSLLPTTLFYQENGQLSQSHLGELSAASLAIALQK